MDRKFILAKIESASDWTFSGDINNYEIIKENLKFLKGYLRLNNLNQSLMKAELFKEYENIRGYLNSRQMRCMINLNVCISEKNVQGAYHELCDFIHAYNKRNDQEIDTVERVIINNCIIQIERLLVWL
ncbi:hypothetical protein [Clostridium butyricum]|uniref:hypothetical protein n=1 Tax=Clostridium butyricum TaxID=1492 RepID=UPI00374FD04C